MQPEAKNPLHWLDRPVPYPGSSKRYEVFLFVLILTLAFISRFTGLGDRPLSHDESIHIFYSYLFSEGQGYFHTPLSHGPLQFHLIALLFSFFGSSDFLGRLPHAIASVAAILLIWNWRRYLGSAGVIISALFMLISPYMLYYGRYARNEAFVALFGILTLYAILRYLETGKNHFLYLLTLATVLHFAVKETAFIYTAQALLFLAVYFVIKVSKLPWQKPGLFHLFRVVLTAGLFLTFTILGLVLYNRGLPAPDATLTAAPVIPGLPLGTTPPEANPSHNALDVLIPVLGYTAGVAIIAAACFLFAGIGWKNIRQERSFDMLILLGTFVLPQLAAFPSKWLGWDPLAYQFSWPGWNLSTIFSQAPAKTAVVFFILVLLSAVIGLLWDGKRWLRQATIFWFIYILFYSSFFTNPAGFFTGTVGSLGYWLEQQAVRRGNQPWYYYLFVQIPLYEFLPALGTILALFFGFRRKTPVTNSIPQVPGDVPGGEKVPVFTLLLWWTISSLCAFTIAGEKMPWLTVHIVLPMILLSGWGLAKVIESMHWPVARKGRSILSSLFLLVLPIALIGLLACLLGADPPFQGNTQDQLHATGQFLFWFVVLIACGGWFYYLTRGLKGRNIPQLAIVVIFTFLAFLTGRTAFRAAYVNSDNATEYLVYAHGASGINQFAEQIKTISQRISGGFNDLIIAYDAGGETQGVSWPWKWYMRNYPNARPYNTVDDSLLEAEVIIADPQSFSEVSALTGSEYYQLDTLRMVWPNQDYFNMTWDRLGDMLTDRQMRAALFQIWYNRDFSLYAQVTGKGGFNLSNWNPGDKMRMYIRKDVAEKVWEFNLLQKESLQEDPYEQGMIQIPADLNFGSPGSEEGLFNAPHGIAAAPDGSLYVADTWNHRIQHFTSEGVFLESWGSFADVAASSGAPIGTFNQPSAVAVSPDGEWVYVVDTWNHRIQKFTADGEPVTTWGYGLYHASLGDPFGLWGPRGIAVDGEGCVFVTDTGNKRIVVYDGNGNFISQFGGAGMQIGQLDEPVGIAVDGKGFVYIADTWNQRIQVFSPSEDRLSWAPYLHWDVLGWYGDSLENKPMLAIDDFGHIFVADPDLARVLEFTIGGAFLRAWGISEFGSGQFELVSGLAVDNQGRVWVSDAKRGLLSRFSLP